MVSVAREVKTVTGVAESLWSAKAKSDAGRWAVGKHRFHLWGEEV